jgi:hypothetical protein
VEKYDDGSGSPRYGSPTLFRDAVEAYFASKGKKPLLDLGGHAIMDAKGAPVIVDDPPTVAGLAYHLGFRSRQFMYDYGHKRGPEYAEVVDRAKLRMEASHEGALSYRDKCTGDIAWLNNHAGYTSDRREVKHSGMMGTAAVNMTPEEEETFKRNMGVFFKPAPQEAAAEGTDAEPAGSGGS